MIAVAAGSDETKTDSKTERTAGLSCDSAGGGVENVTGVVDKTCFFHAFGNRQCL